MAYKALFLDVDGTTVVHGIDSMPSARVVQAIHACEKKGVRVHFATSRPPRAVQKILSVLPLCGYCICSSGAQIYDVRNMKVIIERDVPSSIVRMITSLATEYGVNVCIYDGEKEVVYAPGIVPKKIVGMYFPELLPEVLQQISKRLVGVSGISLHRMDAWNKNFECLDIVNDKASKLHGIMEVTNLLGIQAHEIIGIGDGYNDLPLLMACGLKIAMGNAVPELKAIADFVAPTVEEDGVAAIIEKFILTG